MPHRRVATSVAAISIAAISIAAISIAAILASPARAQVHLLLTSCPTDGSAPVVAFAFLNAANSGPAVCQITALPVTAECFPLGCVVPDAWSCFPGDVTTFLRADDEGGCIAPGETLPGFQLTLLEDNCCLQFAYWTSDGTPLGNEEVCFDCEGLEVEPRSWGNVKRLYD